MSEVPRRAVFVITVSERIPLPQTNTPSGTQKTTVGTVFINVAVMCLLLIIPVAMTVIGSINFDNCPAEPYLPVYLIVAGSLSTVRIVVQYSSQLKNSKHHREIVLALKFLDIFVFIWLVIGSYWVYHIFKPNYYNSAALNYCDKLVYVFAFVIITLTYLLYFLLVIFSLLLC